MTSTVEKIEYRGYTIEPNFRNPYRVEPEFMYYPTEEGIQHDADCDEHGMVYTGNCKWADSLEDAKECIDWTIDC